MNVTRRLWVSLLGMAALAGVLTACGGGGGGGGGAVVPASYDGETAQAVITADNATPIVTDVWVYLVAGRNSGDFVPVPGGGTAPTADGRVLPLAVVTDTGTLFGNCGGQADYSFTGDDVTGNFSGTITYTAYCNDGVTMSGINGVSGRIDLNTGFPLGMQLTFDDLNVTDGIENYTFTEGSMNFAFAEAGETATLDMVVRDNVRAKSYWMNNCALAFDYIDEFSDFATITGRFYDFDYGYVDIATSTPLLVPETVRPTAGVLLFTGVTSKARLAFNPDASALLEVDANNDGIFETSLGNPFEL